MANSSLNHSQRTKVTTPNASGLEGLAYQSRNHGMLLQEGPESSKTRDRSRDSSEFDFAKLLDTHRPRVFVRQYTGFYDTGLDSTGYDAAKSVICCPQRTRDWKPIAPINCPARFICVFPPIGRFVSFD